MGLKARDPGSAVRRNMISELSEKESIILRSVIDLYVREGVPVSSLKIQQAGMAMSTASIRNVLARLEKYGLLAKPHVSAGRIPTDDGYRFFVNAIEPNQTLCSAFSAMLREQVKQQKDINSIMSVASRLLGSLSKNFAVVYGSAVQERRVNRIYMVALEGSRIHVIVHLLPDYERTMILRTERAFAPEKVRYAESLINPLIHNKSLREAMDALDNAVRDNITDEGIVMREVAANRDVIFSDPPADELYFEDREHMFEQPGLSDPATLQTLLRLLRDKKYLTSILSRRLAERTTVTIGGENEDEVLKPFSLVTSGYRMSGSRGVLGVIGPTRMRYDLVYFLVGSIAKELQAIGEEFF